MQPQEIFDTVVRHLAQQGGPAKDGNGDCVYRGQNNTKCAVGCLIPDEMYRPEMDVDNNTGNGTGLTHVLSFEVPQFFRVNDELLRSLQLCHDDWEPEYDGAKFLVNRLSYIATSYNLDTTVIGECFPAESVQ